jgi:hypothetical protein
MLPLGQSAALGRRFIDLDPELIVAVLRTIEAGWELATERPGLVCSVNEVTMTECLRDAMRNALTVHGFPWRKMMIIAPGSESRSRPGMTAPDGRTDIPLFLVPVFIHSGEHDPHAIIECKRVAEGDATLTREYVVEGIDRFTTGKYAENHSRGFMIGYVLSGSGTGVVKGVNVYLERSQRTEEILTPTLFGHGTTAWTSQHWRQVRSSTIALHHTMLLFRRS